MAMDTLDEINNSPDPNEVTPYKTGLKYGIILVVVGLVFQIVVNVLGLASDPLLALVTGTISLALTITVILFAIRYHRDQELGGFISFRRGLAVSFWMGISYGAVVGIWVWFNNNILAPETNETQQRELEKIRAQVEDGEMPQEMLVYSEMIIEATSNPILMMTMALLSILFIGLFVSLFTKRERPLT